MKKKICLGLVLAVACGVMAADGGKQPPNTRRECRTWSDPVLRVTFPERLGDLAMSSRTTFQSGDFDYSLRYDSDESRARGSGGKHVDLYIFTRDGKPMKDGVNDKVTEQAREAKAGVKVAEKYGYYKNVKQLNMMVEGKMQNSGLKYLWTSHTLTFPNSPKPHQSVTLVFAWRNRFVKMRYSEPIVEGEAMPCETLPPSFVKVVDAFDALIANGMKAP